MTRDTVVGVDLVGKRSSRTLKAPPQLNGYGDGGVGREMTHVPVLPRRTVSSTSGVLTHPGSPQGGNRTSQCAIRTGTFPPVIPLLSEYLTWCQSGAEVAERVRIALLTCLNPFTQSNPVAQM
jgi:hypothetical protein